MWNSSDVSWAEREFSGIDFGDVRLARRFAQVMQDFSRKPEASVNRACPNWRTTKAAYRMLENEKIQGDEIIRVHVERIQERAATAKILLAIQDTTTLNYNAHPTTEGLGHIGSPGHQHTQGLMMHTTLGVTSEGLPVGLLRQDIWARQKGPKHPKKNGKRDKSFKDKPIETKESMKWIRSLEALVKLQAHISAKLISVGDRESDIFEYIQRANEMGIGFLIRATRNRVVTNGDESSLLWTHMEQQAVLGQILNLKVPEKKGQAARIAEVSVRWDQVNLRTNPKRASIKNAPDESVYAILVREENPPADVEGLEWMLLTNQVIKTQDQALEKIDWYKKRWHIESFHKTLKSGCRVEDCRLNSGEKLMRYLTIFSIIACRLYWITHLGRRDPDAPCTDVLETHEWQALDCFTHQAKTPRSTPPTNREAIRWIAQLGGFLGRKGDGEPGMIVIWRGWTRLTDIAETWRVMKTPETCG